MKIKNNQNFNLMNTNGRRADVADAYTIYLQILRQCDDEWASFPKSLAQFNFYAEAVRRSPETFKQHKHYDQFLEWLTVNDAWASFLELDERAIRAIPNSAVMLESLDRDIEARARHYVSNLVKIGFFRDGGEITPSGMSYVEGNSLTRDPIERLLPIDDINLGLLRQVLQFRVYNQDDTKYYSPGILALAICSEGVILDRKSFVGFLQKIHPQNPFEVERFKELIIGGDINRASAEYSASLDGFARSEVDIPVDPTEEQFLRLFKNQKSSKAAREYYEFYRLLKQAQQGRVSSIRDLEACLSGESREKIVRAFGLKGDCEIEFPTEPELQAFIHLNADNPLFDEREGLARILYERYQIAKYLDTQGEYNDTTRRILGATGLFSFENGIVQMNSLSVFRTISKSTDLWRLVFGSSSSSSFVGDSGWQAHIERPRSVVEILGLSGADVVEISESLMEKYGLSSPDEVEERERRDISARFEEFVNREFPIAKVRELLALFEDRSNDRKIKNSISQGASIPTLYEFIVGLAWYHMSSDKYDLFDSFNLSFDGDFYPVRFAGGGDGDIVIRHIDRIIQIEATMMNASAQKRGEWEPVLRHAVNLTLDMQPLPVYTVFVASELDWNTIHIWRAVSNVPLRSSKRDSRDSDYCEGVSITPLRSGELNDLLGRGVPANRFINSIVAATPNPTESFDSRWRDDILDSL